MPQKTYGPQVRSRVKRLFEALLSYANDELEVSDLLRRELVVNWKTENKLVVRTKLRRLEELTEKDKYSDKLTTLHIRNAINDLIKYLEIAEDHREHSQGAENWHFTLSLWSNDKEENLKQFDLEWENRRSLKSRTQYPASKQSGGSSADTNADIDCHNHDASQKTASQPDKLEDKYEDTQPFQQNDEFEAFRIIIDIIEEQKNKEIDVITISANNYDVFYTVDKISPEHESVIKDKPFSCAGGSGANTVCGLSRLGKNTAIVGCVKNDSEGKELFNSFRTFSVNTDLLISDDTDERNTKTGSTIVLVEESSARRQIVVNPGINNCLSDLLLAENEKLLEAVLATVKKSKILHLSSFASEKEMNLQLTVLKRINNQNILVSLTPGAIYVKGGLEQLYNILAYTNIMFLYTQQLEQLLSTEIRGDDQEFSIKNKVDLFFEWMSKKDLKHPMIVVIKDYSIIDRSRSLYENHIYVADNYSRNKFFKHPIEKFKKKIKTILTEDTTGAGDALVAGFLYGILERENLETCTDFGFIMSTCVSQELGARSNLPDKDLLRGIVNEPQTI